MTPEQRAEALPPLPEPFVGVRDTAMSVNHSSWETFEFYTADQMRAYAELAVAPLHKDAERYRHLRAGKARTTGAPKAGRLEICRWEDKSEGSILKGDALDAAVDDAMAAAVNSRLPNVGGNRRP